MQIYGALCTTKGKITHEMDVLLQHKGLEWLFEVKTGCFWSYEICEQPLTKEGDCEMHLLGEGKVREHPIGVNSRLIPNLELGV